MSFITLSIMDMTELYGTLLENGGSVIPSLIVIDEMTGEFNGQPFQFGVPKEGSKETILILEKDNIDTMKEKLLNCIELFNCQKNVSDIIISGYPFTSFSQPQKIYKNALDICKKLDIQLPQILQATDSYIGPEMGGKRFTALDENDRPIGDLVFLKRRGINYQIHSLAHELRHCWQEYKETGFFINYQELTKNNYIEFNMQPEEIDAEAYACLYMEKKFGFVDGTSFMFNSDEDESSWHILTKKIKEYMRKIQL